MKFAQFFMMLGCLSVWQVSTAGKVVSAPLNGVNSPQTEASQPIQNEAFFQAHDLIQAFEKNPSNLKLAKQAIEKLKQSLQQSPEHEPILRKAAMNNLAVLLVRLKQYDEAREWLLKSLNEEEWVATTLENLNQLYAYEAQQAYKEVFEKSVVQTPRGEFLRIPPRASQADQRSSSNKQVEPEINVEGK
ncbi:tetratricopeptide repeat protein [Thiomicrorhabdus indica]|uniref:tetratricopeptide repeat protein n=1 Tax=Thiomicrorhabdus indica TaxID=2267253 RepID=UPI002AA84EDE|nr:tetratricopeptide repeat protein [Thiomicrorhabdus indica]